MSGTLHDALGEERIGALAAAWHRRCLADEVVSHAFSHGYHPHHVDRLTAYWIEQLGGPRRYTDAGLGTETDVVRAHSGNGEHGEMDERALACSSPRWTRPEPGAPRRAERAVGVTDAGRFRVLGGMRLCRSHNRRPPRGRPRLDGSHIRFPSALWHAYHRGDPFEHPGRFR